MKIANYKKVGFYLVPSKAEMAVLPYGPYVIKGTKDKLCFEQSASGAVNFGKDHTLKARHNYDLELFGLTPCEFRVATSFKGFVVTLPLIREPVGKFVPFAPSRKVAVEKPVLDLAGLLKELRTRVKDENVEFQIEDSFPVIYRQVRERISYSGREYV